MKVCIAGKNNIAIDVTKALLKYFDRKNIFILTNKHDDGKNHFQKSFSLFADQARLKKTNLSEIYQIENLIFFSLEYERIIHPSLFRSKQFYNIHFSYLPKYKGVFPSVWPILNMEEYSGVTLHAMDAGMDSGDILDQKLIKIDPSDTSKSLYLKCMKEGTALVINNLQRIISNEITFVPQTAEGSTYYSKSSIDFSNLKIELNATANQINSQIRAYSFRDYQLPVVHTFEINSSEILNSKSYIKPGSIVQKDDGFLVIATIDFDIKLYIDFYNSLWECCSNDDLDALNRIINYIPNLEEKNKSGWTALTIAVYNNSINIAKLLLTKGADVNAVNYNETSILMYAKSAAIKFGSREMLDLVLSHKPNILHKDYKDKTVLDYAKDEDETVYNYLNAMV